MSNKARATRRNAERQAAKPTLRLVPKTTPRQRDDEWLNAAIAETMALSNGAVVAGQEERGGAPPPFRRMCGLDFLLSKSRITPTQKAAGDQYGTDWRTVNVPHLPSCLREIRGDASSLHIQETVSAARKRLESARSALGAHPQMVGLCNVVAGDGKRVRAFSTAEADVQKNEAVLSVALDLLAAHYGMTNA